MTVQNALPTTRRTLLAGAVTAGPFLALAACSSAGSGGSEGEDGTPVDGGTLNYAVEAEPTAGGIDPVVGVSIPAESILRIAYEGLLCRDDDGEVQPLLASSYEQVDDLTWRFTLREGVKFADGTDLTVEDVVYSVEQMRNNASKASYLSAVAEVATIDAGTLEFRFATPDGRFLNAMANRDAFYVLSAAGYGAASEDDRQRNTYGTGPFQVSAWTDGVSIEMSKNPHYWSEGLPHLDTLEMSVVPDESTRLASVQQGSAQAGWLTDGNLAEQAASTGLTQGEPAYIRTLAIYFNPTSGPTADIRVRRALSLSLDRQALVDVAMLGFGKVSLLPPSGDPASPQMSDAVNYYDRDLDQAKALLAEAGQTAPTIPLMYMGDVAQAHHPIYELMQQQAAEAGITLQLKATPLAEVSPIFTTGEAFDGMVSIPASFRADPTNYFDSFLEPGGVYNHVEQNPDADLARTLLEQAKATVDPDAKAALVQELAEEVADKALVIVPLATAAYFEVWDGNTVKGYDSDAYTYRTKLTGTWVQS